jgi:predicted enzyme related to lactoylglutathione lyase
MLEKVAFTMYPAKDIARARKFYGEVLGLSEGSKGNRGEQWWVEYDLPQGGCFALTNFTQDEPSANGGTIAFEVTDIEKLCAELQSKGVTFKSDLIATPVCRMRVISDSEGNSILLHQLHKKP